MVHSHRVEGPPREQASCNPKGPRCSQEQGKGGKGPGPKGKSQTGKFGHKQFQKLEQKVQNQKRQLAVLQAARTAPKSDDK
jgi:hypothetical protein